MLEYRTTTSLLHDGDCHLIGISADFTVYVEEIYGDSDWMAQAALTLDGQIIKSVDEDHGTASRFSPIQLPGGLVRPRPVHHAAALNFRGPRLRGMREAERIREVVYPLEIAARMKLAQQFRLDIPPPLILGIAASEVLSETLVTPPHTWLVCRRLRVAYTLPQPAYDEDQQPYDYDTLVFHIAHFYNAAAGDQLETALEEGAASLPGADLRRPLDCLADRGYLFMTEGGTPGQNSRLHVWKIAKQG